MRDDNVTVTVNEEETALIDLVKHDPVNQHVSSQEIFTGESGIKLYPVQVRYSWPSELDLMAWLVGLRLRERWGDWDGSPFTESSENHISIYERAA